MMSYAEYIRKLKVIECFLDDAVPICTRLRYLERPRRGQEMFRLIFNICGSLYNKRRTIKRLSSLPMIGDEAFIRKWNRKLDNIGRNFFKINKKFTEYHKKLQHDYIYNESLTLSSKVRELFLKLLDNFEAPTIID